MTRSALTDRAAWLVLMLIVATALLAPWLPLRPPNDQPDGLVLRELPPLTRVLAVQMADGSQRFAHAVDDRGSDGLALRRGERWTTITATELAGPRAHQRVRSRLFVLGTDGLGRDLFSRLIHGARVSLWVGLIGACMALGIGCCVGLAAGFGGPILDAVLMRTTDLLLSVPRIFLALLLVSLYGASLATTVVVLGGTTWMAAARLVRGEVLSLRERDFIVAAHASGASRIRIALRHLLPLVAVPVTIEGVLRVADVILLEAALSFLGLGVPPPTASWGNLIADGRGALLDAWWISTFPGLAIAVTVITLSAVGETARRGLATPRDRAPRADYGLFAMLLPRRAF